MVHYDYIIAGAGASGLSLLMRMIQSGRFDDKSILLVDRDEKTVNDRTWCFWEKDEGFFESLVFRRWQKLWFHTHHHSSLHDISPYTYKLIRGKDFYRHCFEIIRQHPNITTLQREVTACFSDAKQTGVRLGNDTIYAGYVFNSILFRDSLLAGNHHYLLQHFKGWIVQTVKPAFNPKEATLMDFRTDQRQGTTFVYVMPLSDTTALVEYTLFSAALLDDSLYDKGLRKYCGEILKLDEYNIIDTEFGVIPMTNYAFQAAHDAVINIGTAGGQTKSSTGYTFQFIQEHTQKIVAALVSTGKPFLKDRPKNRVNFYDAVLLNILAKNRLKGEDVFDKLIHGNKLKQVMKFLENKTNLVEELYLIRNLPKRIFLSVAKEEMLKLKA